MEKPRALEILALIGAQTNPHKAKNLHMSYELGYLRGFVARLAHADSLVAQALVDEYKRVYGKSD